jgi:hypothetical protein
MLRAKFVLCAETILHDKNTNMMSAINILENRTAVTLPAPLPKFSVLASFERDAEDPPEQVVSFFLKLDEEELATSDLTVHFVDKGPEKGLINRTTVTYAGLVVTRVGILRASFSTDGRELGYYEIRIDAKTSPPEIGGDGTQHNDAD